MTKYIKHSLRQLRKTVCAKCGTDKLYYSHEQVNEADPNNPAWCIECANRGEYADGPLVLVDMDTLKPHSCTATGPTNSNNDGDSEGNEESKPADDFSQWESEHSGKPVPQPVANDPWENDEPPPATDDLAEQLKAISESAEKESATVAGMADQLVIISQSSESPPFPDDDEYVTHKELNEFDPVKRVEMYASHAQLKDVVDKAHDSAIRQSEKLIKLTDAMRELERRTRVTIFINDVAANEETEISGLHHRQLPDVIRTLTVAHCLMVGGAGAGKGEIAYQAAEALKIPFYTLDQGSLSPQTPVSAIIGYMNSSGEYVGTTFRQAFEHGGLIFLDELDNAQPACVATINAALAIREGQPLGFPGGQMVKRHKDFKVLAAANTYGRGPDRTYAARQRGDAATWDRFSMLTLEYDTGLEDVLCRRTGIDEERFVKVVRYVRKLRSNVKEHQLPVVIGMRASIEMCALINAGFTPEQAIDMRCRRGVSDADWAKMSQGASFFPVAAPAKPQSEINVSFDSHGNVFKPDGFNINLRPGQHLTGNYSLAPQSQSPLAALPASGKVEVRIRYTLAGGLNCDCYIRDKNGTAWPVIAQGALLREAKFNPVKSIKSLMSANPGLSLPYARDIIKAVADEMRKLPPAVGGNVSGGNVSSSDVYWASEAWSADPILKPKPDKPDDGKPLL